MARENGRPGGRAENPKIPNRQIPAVKLPAIAQVLRCTPNKLLRIKAA
jgi:hypothetical protein